MKPHDSMRLKNFQHLLHTHLMLAVVFLSMVSCTSVPKEYARTPSTAYERPETTTAGKLFTGLANLHPQQSGFLLLASGEDAFMMRSAMAGIAEKTLDVQYYIWEADDSGRILVSHLLQAADRGVRVRLLLDDIHTEGKDFDIAQVDSHPNIEIRLFNPFVNRDWRSLDWLTDSSRINHRMHNKVFAMDNAMAIVGGRNIGDHYFGVHTVNNFRDLDLLSVGPAVRDISASFDQFWNSEWAIPMAAFAKAPIIQADAKAAFDELHKTVANIANYPFNTALNKTDFLSRLQNARTKFLWADYQVIYDPPEKVTDENQQGIAPHLKRLVEGLQKELAIESAYFIPGTRFREVTSDLRQQGVRIKVLTNSLASNDVTAAHAGYASVRKQLLENGVELYELRPDAEADRKRWNITASSQSSLHSKVIVFDKRTVVIGTFNLDPRSANINTEIALVVESSALADQVVAIIDNGMRPENSYRLILEDQNDSQQLVWITEQDGEELCYITEPEASLWRRLGAWFFSLLPIRHQL